MQPRVLARPLLLLYFPHKAMSKLIYISSIKFFKGDYAFHTAELGNSSGAHSSFTVLLYRSFLYFASASRGDR